MRIEAMKQALKALEKSQSALAEELSAWDIDPPLHHVQESHDLCGPAITSLRQAIDASEQHTEAEPSRSDIKQEPVGHGGRPMTLRECMEAEEQIYNREWVDLTDEEINEWTPEIHVVIRAIQAKLKEKNT